MTDARTPKSGEPTSGPDEFARLREEHDRLAEVLKSRRSIDHVRRGSMAFFVGFIGVGLCGKLAWDFWGIPKPGEPPRPPHHGVPLFLYFCMVFTVATLAYSISRFLDARRLSARESALFARFLELRDRLGVDR